MVDAIDAHIDSLKKEIVDLDARREHLISSVTTLDRFWDKTLITGL